MANAQITFTGVVLEVGPELTVGQKGTKKVTIIVDNGATYNSTIPVTFIGQATEQTYALKQGDSVSISGFLEGREGQGQWKGKYYLDFNGKQASVISRPGTASSPVAQPAGIPRGPEFPSDDDGQLPF